MKLITIFLFLVTFCLQANNTYSQNTIVNLDLKNVSLIDVFREIEKQSDYRFFFHSAVLNTVKKQNVKFGNRTISAILNQLFQNTDITYKLVDKYIVITSKRATKDSFPPPVEKNLLVEGFVSDKSGEPVIGANVSVKGTTTGASTDINGKFTLTVPENSILLISYIGYLSQEIEVHDKSVFHIVLQEDTRNLEEVVVVGYGVQKKANLTGAVATVGAKELEDRPITNAAQALQGKIANFNVYNSDGRPGSKASFNIRGYAGLGTTYSPLVIIDGVTGYFEDLNPNDIETFTVLKDAAASAIYGAQAAYGVILITTKSGKKNEKPVISYNNNFSFNSPTVLPKTAGSLEFAKLFREASINDGGGGVIDLETLERIEKYYDDPGSIPNNVPQLDNPDRWSDWGDGRSNANEDWARAMFKNNQLNQSHALSIQGGSGASTYMMSLGYLKDGGKLRYYNDYYQRYNATAKINTDVTKWLTVGMNIRYAREKNVTPAYYMDPEGGINNLINWIWVVWPTIPVFDPNGHFSPAGRMAFIHQANPNITYTDNFWGTVNALFKITPGWTAHIDFTYNKYASKQTYSKGLIYSWSVHNEPYLDSSSQETTQVWQKSNNDDFTSMNAYTTYEKGIRSHHFKLMFGMQQEYKKNWGESISKMGLVLPDQPSVSTATGKIEATDRLDHYTTMGFFGRLNYDYDSRYLFELNVRHDGSSRYAEGHKWGTFPAFSVGWNVAKENFFRPYTSLFSELRLRSSWGELGNMRGKEYQYISTIPYYASYRYIMDSQLISAFGSPSMIAYNTWEKNKTLDFGVDMVSLDNRLNISFDWYRRDIIGLITKGQTVPVVLGAESPSTNNADIRNKGWELTIGWKHSVLVAAKSFNYGISFNISDYQGTVMRYSNPKGLIDDWYVGKKMGEIWGYTTDHIIIDPTEAEKMNTTGSQKLFGSNWAPGDMAYKDLDKSGSIDYGNKTLSDHGDLSIIGNNTPRYNFGFGVDCEWNGFDFSAFLQGTAKRDLWLSGRLAWGIGGGQWGSNVWENTLDCWREDGSNMNPYWPRFYLGNTSKNLQTQTKYLNSGAYCRLKNIRFGYSLPKQIISHVGLQRVRFYFSGDNLLTISGINSNFDPESPGDNVYPLSKSLSFGINLTF
ncbi:TonB-dependent receptor [Parabacteroides pacaensis]|uniref:TonB-dependent receptor n=1 Tax=Parabacteroides pacaensis TaxID=2086575 RepID=UPI001F236C19|nr:TonB-dependent receptor [Parabacteroides pacaensis]